MNTFLIIIGFLIVLGYVVGTFQNNKKVESKSNRKKITKQNIKTETDLLYKKREIKSFSIKGTHFQKNVNSNDSGPFVGYVTTENNKHDKYAVAIYNNENKKIGFVPKGNYRLNESLKQWHNGKILAWGNLTWDDYHNDWNWYDCIVKIPIGLKTEELESIKRIFELRNNNGNILKKENVSSEDYFSYLENYYTINKEIDNLKIPDEFYEHFPKNLIPRISKQLEKEKKWEKLIELEQYSDLINDLSEKFKETTMTRIEKAKQNLPQHLI